MSEQPVTMVRIYLTEREHLLDRLLARLHDEEQVSGVTVFRAISGFGQSGKLHSSTLLDMSFDLPIVVEFFDTPDKARTILAHLADMIEPGHMVSWPASVHL